MQPIEWRLTWHSDHGVLDLLAKEGLGGLLHFRQDHGTDLLGRESLCFSILHLNLNVRFGILVHDLVWHELHIPLNFFVIESVKETTKHPQMSRAALNRGWE